MLRQMYGQIRDVLTVRLRQTCTLRLLVHSGTAYSRLRHSITCKCTNAARLVVQVIQSVFLAEWFSVKPFRVTALLAHTT
jgi:hypothetical protein